MMFKDLFKHLIKFAMIHLFIENFHLYNFQLFSLNINRNATTKMQTQSHLKAMELSEGYWLGSQTNSCLVFGKPLMRSETL